MRDSASSPVTEGSAQLPITRVTLFTTGVGFFEHAGIVVGNAELELSVPPEHMDDLLQSLVARDLGGGLVEAVRYASRNPLERVLRSYRFDLTANPTLHQLLDQARGERVRVSLDEGEAIAGVVVGVEERGTRTEERTVWLTLTGDAGLRRIDLASVRAIAFERAEVREQLDAALAAIARYRDADGVPVAVRFTGEGERNVRVAYLRAMPVWKASYRLTLGEAGGDLQAWAVFDNPTNLDLSDVRVAFVAGRPASFVAELFEPVWVERPRVAIGNGASVPPPRDDGGRPFARQLSASRMGRIAATEAPMVGVDLAPAPLMDVSPGGADLRVMAEGVAGTASFAYRVEEPVTVGRYESALVPILQARVEAHAITLFDPNADEERPFRAARVVNDSGAFLAAGPVAVFEADGFVGMALLGDVPPGDERILSFAADVDVRVRVEHEEHEEFVSLRLAVGSFTTEVRTIVTTTYFIDARPGVRRFLVIDHAARAGFDLTQPVAPAVRTRTGYRFGVQLGAAEDDPDAVADPAVPVQAWVPDGAPGLFQVVQERVDARWVAVASLDRRRAQNWLEETDLEPEVRARLEAYVAAQTAIERIDGEIERLEARRTAIEDDQDRVRQNMTALERPSPLYERYVADLVRQEDELAAAAARVTVLSDERRVQQERVKRVLEGLDHP